MRPLVTRIIATFALIAGYVVPLRYPAAAEALIATNDLWPEVGIISGRDTAPDARSSLKLLMVLITYVLVGVVLFELAKVLLAAGKEASVLRIVLIALAQSVLVADCIRRFAWDWWLFLTGWRSAAGSWPWIAMIVTLAAIVAVWLPHRRSHVMADSG